MSAKETEIISSPKSKKPRLLAYSEHGHVAANSDNFEEDDDDHEENQEELKQLTALLPKVLENLKKADQTSTYVKFHRLVAEDAFPLKNIAYLLFLDIVNWFCNSKTTTQMRYSEDVKKFWRVGQKLFKGKFLRFMSGLKNSGQVFMENDHQGIYKPSESKVNFAVPDKKILEKMKSPVASSAPGIITEMIDAVSSSDPDKVETFKLCVDGKKLNAGVQGQKLGDVNLWGFEDTPTLAERELKLNEDLSTPIDLKSSYL